MLLIFVCVLSAAEGIFEATRRGKFGRSLLEHVVIFLTLYNRDFDLARDPPGITRANHFSHSHPFSRLHVLEYKIDK